MAVGNYLKLASGGKDKGGPSEARQNLAAAIAKHGEVVEAINANEATVGRLRGQRNEIEAKVERAREELNGAKTLRRERLFDPDLPAPRVSVRDAEAMLAEAEEELAEIHDAVNHARDVRSAELRQQKDYAKMAVDGAAAKVLAEASQGDIEQMCSEARQARDKWYDLRAAVDFLKGRGADVRVSLFDTPTHSQGPIETRWRAAFESLKSDATATFPEGA